MAATSRFEGFRFKQFAIEHKNCAMKVGTDGILLGSWIPTGDYSSILDIGTGSGLIAIMLAQRSVAQCDILGIDIDQSAILQAQKNALNCPWSSQLTFVHRALQQLPQIQRYDLIVSNPPYFEGKSGELLSSDANFISDSRRKARHNNTLNFSELFQHVSILLNKDAYFYCILPAETIALEALAQEHGLYCDRRTWVKSSPFKPPKRQLLRFGFEPAQPQVTDLCIHDCEGAYSADYIELCRDYYLNF
ncbi:tRNA1(Val) (adenine(37)-N6)-methyltransferase [Aliiglaciecola lipolytica]|uniref:tRNA1(Val) (adenine(37)-N6)-methyltransferase n=1 Tax=Aliiglaciecola lipolytica E3 TaxID=1127673 RepID=K6YFN4_9ALTE|nr:methyltransferase [Aliiglaciecola lipolytica]GAC16962.1 tRNA (adenine-N(6)-)-methyltransferase [Aliiglaciecola lipolytica E3]